GGGGAGEHQEGAREGRVPGQARAKGQQEGRRRDRLDDERLMRRRNGQPPEIPTPLPPGGGRAVSAPELQARRTALMREFATLRFDLGGLAYEMAIRDHFRLDLLARQAARLQEIDAQLGAIEQLARIDS